MPRQMAVSLGFWEAIIRRLSGIRRDMKSLERSHYEALIDTIPVAAALIRAGDGRIILINDIALSSLKLERSKTVGIPAPDLLVDIENRESFVALFRKQDLVENFTTTLRRGDGAQVTVIFSASRMKLDGETMLMSVFKDITPLVETQTALREQGNAFKQESQKNFEELVKSNQKLNYLLNHSLQGILVHRDKRPLFVNQSFADILGYSIDEIMTFDDMLMMVAPEQRDYLTNDAVAALHDPKSPHLFRIKALKNDGTEIWVSNRSEIVDWDDGPAVLATITDITSEVLATRELERVNQELEQRIEERTQDLRLSESRLETAVTLAKFGYGTYSPAKNKYLYCSAEHASFYGLEPADFIGQPSKMLGEASMMHPEDRAFAEVAKDDLKLGRRIDIEHRILGADGNTRWIRQIGVPIRDPNGDIVEERFFSQDMTERKLLEERLLDTNASLEALVETRTSELAASEGKFRTLAEHSLVGLAIIQNNRFQFVNPAWADLYGFAVDELLAFEEPLTLIDPRDQAKIRGLVEARLLGEAQDGRLELRGIRKDGSLIWLDNARVPITWDGKPASLISNLDITERKAAESALQESQGLLASIVENAPYAFSIKTRGGKYLMYKGGGMEFLRRNPTEFFERPLSEVLSVEVAAEIQDADNQVLKTGRPVGIDEELLIHQTGTDLRLIKFPIRDANGVVERIGTIATDVTREIEDRRKLLESERATREIFESSLIGAAVYDRATARVTFANTQLLEILGTTLEEFKDHSPSWIWADASVRDRIIAQMHAEGSAHEFVELRKVDGTPVWCMFACRLSAGDKDEVMFWVHDLTDLHETQIALIAAKDQAETADQAKTDFLSAMSHELRTPLNAVLGFAQLLESDADTSLNEDQSTAVRMILSSGQLLLSLINEVLDLTRIQDGNVRLEDVSVDLETMLVNCVNLVSPLVKERGLSMNFNVRKFRDLEVRGDTMRFKQVILNLLQNAVKYNRDDGTISVRAAVIDGDKVRVTISDTGKGIAEHHRDTVFNPFERLGEANGPIEGTGIGLTIAKRLIEAMNGSIGVESQVGKGSDFWIELPRGHVRAAPVSDPVDTQMFV